MKMMKVLTVVGARPQFVKAAVVSAALKEAGVEEVLVHTGQHYDHEMSALFFDQLGLSEPAYNLGVGSDSHGAQTARILEGIEQLLVREKPDMLLVYGDTNSTLAGALAASKLHIAVAHVEAGLRSYNRRMPEEINRVLTDHVSDLLFVPTQIAVDNLRAEGIEGENVIVTGDVMYDCVLRFREAYEPERARLLDQWQLRSGEYFIATVHRAENTDEPERLRAIAGAFEDIASSIGPVLWPIHPRTRKKLEEFGIALDARVVLAPPIGYLQMQALLAGARGALTDSGGLQKEAAFHGVPTLTLRDETEWPETVTAGCNVLVGADRERIVEAARRASGRVEPPAGFGNGDASRIVAETIRNWRNHG
jgi:UDP-N-acetylglucosamine 2-epimerase